MSDGLSETQSVEVDVDFLAALHNGDIPPGLLEKAAEPLHGADEIVMGERLVEIPVGSDAERLDRVNLRRRCENQSVFHAEFNESFGGVHAVGAVHVDVKENDCGLLRGSFVLPEECVCAAEQLHRDRRALFLCVAFYVVDQPELVCP